MNELRGGGEVSLEVGLISGGGREDVTPDLFFLLFFTFNSDVFVNLENYESGLRIFLILEWEFGQLS